MLSSLITIMLVRLRMTASAALHQYFYLAGKIISKKNTKRGKESVFKASTLENISKGSFLIKRVNIAMVHVCYLRMTAI